MNIEEKLVALEEQIKKFKEEIIKLKGNINTEVKNTEVKKWQPEGGEYYAA